MLPCMATIKQKVKAEQSGRAMLEQAGVRQPDEVEYGYTCIRFLWTQEKVVLIIEIDKPPEGFEVVGDYLEDLDDISGYLSDREDDAA
jgi:hypothetical protein